MNARRLLAAVAACVGVAVATLALWAVTAVPAGAQTAPTPPTLGGTSAPTEVTVEVPDSPDQAITAIVVITLLSVAPAALMLVTSFTRIVIVLSLVRNALGLQGVPPNQVLAGMALLLTLVVMGPTLNEVNEVALEPYQAGQIDAGSALGEAAGPFKTFMLDQTRSGELAMMTRVAQIEVDAPEDVPFPVLTVAFLLSELKTAFIIGFVIALPFVLVDLIVSSTLMSLGMMMMPPVVVSFPLKLLLFVAVDGWILVVESLVRSFR